MPRPRRSNLSRRSRNAIRLRKIANKLTDEERQIAQEKRRVGMARSRALLRASQTQEQREAARETPSFAMDPAVANRWIEIMRLNCKDKWKANKYTKICSMHFGRKDVFSTEKGLRKIYPGAVPRKCLYLSSLESESENDENSKEQHNSKLCFEKNSTESYADSCVCLFLSAMETESSTNIKQSTSLGQPLIVSVHIKSEPEMILPHDAIDENETGAVESTEKKLPEGPETQNMFMGQPPGETIKIKKEPDDVSSHDTDENGAVTVKVERIFLDEPEPNTLTSLPSEMNNVEVKPDPELITGYVIMDENNIVEETSDQKAEAEFQTSDLDSVCETPREHRLVKELRRKGALQIKHTRIIKALREQNRRLKKRISKIKHMVVDLKIDKSIVN